ncbi:MAG: ATP-binding protein [Bacillota bacterium]
MEFKKIFIRDFGIFRHQHIRDLNSNINLIGGLNRAGKSTFLELLRYIPYGFPKRKNFIKANNKFDVEAELVHKNKRYNLITKGFSEPLLKNISDNNSDLDLNQIYSIDNFSYKQLFTITLDQLKRIPEGTSKNKEKLQSLLLGAGLRELLDLQELKEDYNKRANKIGGKNGSVSVKEFKEYYKAIKEGKNLRKEAKNEINEFEKAKNKLSVIKEEIKNIDNKLKSLNYKQDRLDMLKNNYENLLKVDNLFEKLNNSKKERLINSSLNIDFTSNQLAILKEKVNNYQVKKEKLTTTKHKLLKKAEEFNKNWNDEKYLDYILNINFDLIEKNRLDRIIDEYIKVKNKLEKLKTNKEEKIKQKKMIELKIDNLFKEKNTNYQNKFLILSIIITIIGLLMLIINFGAAVIITISGLSSNYFFIKEKREKNKMLKNNIKEEKNKLNSVELEIENLNEKIKNLKKEKSNLDNNLNKYRDILDLEKETSATVIKDYFHELQLLKNEVKDWQLKKEELKESKNAVINKFEKINIFLKKYNFGIEDIYNIDNAKNLIYNLEKLLEFKNVRSQILNSLKSDRAKNAFKYFSNNNLNTELKLWKEFYSLYEKYISKDDVEDSYKGITKKINSKENKLLELRDKKQSLRDKINSLETSDKLDKGKKIIYKNRKKLKEKAKDYGINLTASFILEKTYEKLLNKIQDDIFSDFSKYLAKITSGEYLEVSTVSELNNFDFQTTLKDGSKKESSEILSRGTKEQLFLAIRLSRINAMNSKLPLIIDDSLVNFDLNHLRNTLDIITDLAKNNQIFILTCHPRIIKNLNVNRKNISYWKLKRGIFSKTSKDKLLKHLL